MENDVRRKKHKRKRNTGRLIIPIAAAIVVVCAGVGAYFYYDYSNRVYSKCQVELGEQVEANDFLKNPNFSIMPDDDTLGAFGLMVSAGFSLKILLTA